MFLSHHEADPLGNEPLIEKLLLYQQNLMKPSTVHHLPLFTLLLLLPILLLPLPILLLPYQVLNFHLHMFTNSSSSNRSSTEQ